MIAPESQIIEITSTVKLLLSLACALFSALFALLGWLAVRLWKAARMFERQTRRLAYVPKLVRVVFGDHSDPERPKPGLARRVAASEESVADLYAVLGVDSVAMKRRAIAEALGSLEDTGTHRALPPLDDDDPERSG